MRQHPADNEISSKAKIESKAINSKIQCVDHLFPSRPGACFLSGKSKGVALRHATSHHIKPGAEENIDRSVTTLYTPEKNISVTTLYTPEKHAKRLMVFIINIRI